MKKFIKYFVLVFAFLFVGVSLASCGDIQEIIPPIDDSEDDNNNNNNNTNDLDVKTKQIYQLAVSSGFSGTYEEWLNSIKGDQIQLSVVDDNIVWKYSKDTEWKTLISAEDLKGDDGLSAYEIYLKYHPEYDGDEEEWINDLVNGKLADDGTIDEIKFTVYFYDYDDEILYNTETIDSNSTISEPTIPFKQGYNFLGWYDLIGNLWDFDTIVTRNTYLFAKWEKISIADPTGLDIHLNYQGESGISYRGTTPFINPIDGKQYTQGKLLPTWQAFSDNLDIEIREASAYTTSSDLDTLNKVQAINYESENKPGEKIDLFYNLIGNIENMGRAGEAVNLKEHLDKMPNFKMWLDENPTMAKQITVDGAIYYTPYFDGYNDIERMFVMNTDLTKAVLDADSFSYFDTTMNGKGAANNTLQESRYTPFINVDYNYAENTKVKVLDGTTVREITVKKTDNIIKQQNELLANGCTGKALAEQFRAYLNTAYGEYIGQGKIFENYSDIFVSEAAAYNVDEMIALFRVVKANPGVITGDLNKEVEIFVPRGAANNRVDNIADIIQIWGVNGMVSEKDMLYFTPDGKLADAATTQGTYDALKNLSAIYSEGLIIGDFYYKLQGGPSTYYLDKYFGRTRGDEYALMLYDYAASTGNTNDKINGIGTDPSKRYISGTSVTGVMPILPPLTYWATESTWKTTQSLIDFTGKSLTRYYGENRGLKTMSWCIPSTSDNIDDACMLMDYLFSDEGSKIQDFGPEEYWKELSDTLVPGEQTPIFSDEFKSLLSQSGTDFWTFMRQYIGSTHSIGCVRSKGLDLQATNAYAQIGLSNVKNAIAYGVVNSALFDKYTYKESWDSSVLPTGYPSLPNDNVNKYGALQSFWASNKCAEEATGWVAYIVKDGCATNNTILGKTSTSEDYTYSDVISQLTIKDSYYLATYQNYLVNN